MSYRRKKQGTDVSLRKCGRGICSRNHETCIRWNHVRNRITSTHNETCILLATALSRLSFIFQSNIWIALPNRWWCNRRRSTFRDIHCELAKNSPFFRYLYFQLGKGNVKTYIGKRIGNFCVNSILDFYCFIEYYALIMYYRDIIHLKWRLYNINMKYISILAGLKYSFEKRIIS